MWPDQPGRVDGTAHVLVADDDPTLRGVLAELLEEEGLRVTTASSGDEVLALLRHDTPDLVLLDARMPCLEPSSFVRDWRAIAQTEGVPVVVLSGLAEVPGPLCRLSAGALLRKPFDVDYLLDVVVQYCPRARRLAQAG
jgi:DNA-binding response OmpR family regulator